MKKFLIAILSLGVIFVLFKIPLLLAFGLLILGTVGYAEKITHLSISKRVYQFLFIIFLIFSIGQIFISWKIDKKIYRLEQELQDTRNYALIAQYSIRGCQGNSGILLSTPISTILDGCFPPTKGGPQSFLCTEEAISKYREVINGFPNFPFGYYCLASCLHKKGDTDWLIYAKKAHKILTGTTKIANHNKDHDDALKKIRILLNKK